MCNLQHGSPKMGLTVAQLMLKMFHFICTSDLLYYKIILLYTLCLIFSGRQHLIFFHNFLGIMNHIEKTRAILSATRNCSILHCFGHI